RRPRRDSAAWASMRWAWRTRPGGTWNRCWMRGHALRRRAGMPRRRRPRLPARIDGGLVMPDVTESLDKLIQAVDRLAARQAANAAAAAAPPRDAIDDALDRPARQTQVVALADSPVMARFRSELSDGLIRIDTLNQVLRLVSVVIERWPLA